MTSIGVSMVVTHVVSDSRERTINVKISSLTHTGNSVGTKKINLSKWPCNISFCFRLIAHLPYQCWQIDHRCLFLSSALYIQELLFPYTYTDLNKVFCLLIITSSHLSTMMRRDWSNLRNVSAYLEELEGRKFHKIRKGQAQYLCIKWGKRHEKELRNYSWHQLVWFKFLENTERDELLSI